MKCRFCWNDIPPGGHCPNCYGRRCARCGQPLLTNQSVMFAANESFHIGNKGCAATVDLTGGDAEKQKDAARIVRRRLPSRA